MRPNHHTLNRRQVHRSAVRHLQEHLPLRDYKRKTTASTLWAVVLWAAASAASLHATCSRLVGLPSEETIRKALYASLPDLAEIQRRLNRALAGRVGRALRRRRQRLAVDLTLIPYYGEPWSDPAEIYRGARKAGTCRFHAYATAYVVLKGERLTVALTTVTRGEKVVDVLRRLLAQARRAGVRPSLLLLDREFYAADVVRHLQAARTPFLMPAEIRGRNADHPLGPSSTRVFALKKRGGWFEHAIRGATKRARVAICVACFNDHGRRRTVVYACWGVDGRSCAWVRRTYKSRFGIETSYRQMNQARGLTTTRRPELRLLYIGLALILRNEWVWLHFEILSTPRRGRRQINLERLPLGRQLIWIRDVIEQDCGTVGATPTERRPCSILRT